MQQYASEVDRIKGIEMAFCILAQKRKFPLEFQEINNKKFLKITAKEFCIEFEISKEQFDEAKILSENLEEENVIKYIFENEADYSTSYEYATANELCDFIIEILGIKKDSQILDAFSGSGNFDFQVFDKVQNSNIDAYEINSNSVLISKIKNYAKKAYINFIERDILRNAFDNKKYDFAFSDSPLSMVYDNGIVDVLNKEIKNLKITINKRFGLTWLIALKIISHLKENGKAVITTGNASLFNLQDKEIREILIKNGYIESIIELPEKLLNNTMVAINLIVLNKNNNKKSINFIDLKDCIIEQRRRNLLNVERALEEYKNKNVITYEEIAKNEYSLNPKVYSKKEEIIIDNPVIMNEVIIDIFRGYQITAKELDQYLVKTEKEANYKIIEISDIDNDEGLSKSIKMINTGDKNLDRYILHDGDILLSARGERIKKHIISIKNNEKIIVNGSINVIRVNKNKMNPLYLKMFLESKKGIATLNKIKTGIVIPTLNIGPLSKIKVPCPSLEEQNKLVEEYCKELELINATKTKLKELREKINEIVNKI